MRVIYIIPLLLLTFGLTGQNENYPALDEQLVLITQSLTSLDSRKKIRLHVGAEKFLTRFPNAPLWTSIGMQIPSGHSNTSMNIYCRYATEGIFRKILPGFGYNYSIYPGRGRQQVMDFGVGVETTFFSVDIKKVNVEESDPLLFDFVAGTTSLRPLLSFGYAYFSEDRRNSFKTDAVLKREFGFTRGYSVLSRVQAILSVGKIVKFKPSILQSWTDNSNSLYQFVTDFEFVNLLSFGFTYLSDHRYGFHMDLPIDMIYREDHTFNLGLQIILQTRLQIPYGGTSYGISINYFIDRI